MLTDKQKQKMDNAAAEAEGVLSEMLVDNESLRPAVTALANWWKENIKAGHKRLGRILLEYADESNNYKREPA